MPPAPMRPPRQATALRRSPFRPFLLAALPLVALTLLAYAGIQRHAFTHYDDWVYITENPHVRGGWSAANIAWAFTTNHAANWHPLTWLSHQLDVECVGLWPGGHHLASLALHALNALILLAVLRMLTGSLWRSAFVAALFALHPTRVESVAWASERKDLLCGLFWFLTMGAYARYAHAKRKTGGGQRGTGNWKPETRNLVPDAQQSRPRSRSRPVPSFPFPVSSFPFRVSSFRWYALTLIAFACALMSKPMAVTLPFVLLLLDWWPLQRMRSVDGEASRGWDSVARVLVEKIPFFLLAALSAVITLRVQAAGGAVASEQFLSFAGRLTNALVAYAMYLKLLILPVRLAVFYPLPVDGYPLWQPLVALALLSVITWIALRAARNRPALLMGWLWFLGTLVPVIGFVKVGMQALADRYTYLPFIGLFIMAAWGGAAKMPDPQATLPKEAAAPPSRVPSFQYRVSSILLLLVCALLTHRQLACWRNSLTLADQALRVTRDNDVAHIIAGNYWAGQGSTDAAIDHYREAVRISPDAALYLYNLGTLYEQAGEGRKAEALYRRTIGIDPDYEKAHLNLGRLYHLQGNVDLAIPEYREVLRINPANAIAHFNLSVALASTGDLVGAIASVERALQVDPSYEMARTHLERLQRRTAQPLP